MNNHNTHCSCNEVSYQITGKPLVRAFCHCTICQRVNRAAFADVTLFKAKDVSLPGEANLSYHAYKFPPILQRGECTQCHDIAIEHLNLFPLPKIVIIPTRNLHQDSLIPEPSLHIFYDKRVADIQDNLPKYHGYLKSQLGFGKKIIGALLK